MGNRRMGARRLNALLGNKLAEDNSNKAGAGAEKWVVSNIVSRRGTEVVTEICVDLGSSEGVATLPGTTDLVIGYSASAAGVQSGGAAYLTKLTPAVNGYIVGAEMVCTELPTAAARDINVRVGTTGTTAFSGTVAGGTPTDIIDAGADWSLGAYKASGSWASVDAMEDTGLENYYVYLTKGDATDGVETTYAAGKYTIKLLGYLACEDK